MSNQSDHFSPASRAMLVGAMVAGGAASVHQWRKYQQGQQPIEKATGNMVRAAAKGALIGGVTTAMAGQMAGRPVLSALTVFSAGVAAFYLMDEIKGKTNEQV